jgi:hypothetical protein
MCLGISYIVIMEVRVCQYVMKNLRTMENARVKVKENGAIRGNKSGNNGRRDF